MSFLIKYSAGPVRTKQREPPPRGGEHRRPGSWNIVPAEAAFEAEMMRRRLEPPPAPPEPERRLRPRLRPAHT